MYTIDFKISGFSCPACLKMAKMDLEELEGVETVDIDEQGKTNVTSSREIKGAEIIEAIKDKKLKVEV